MNVMISGRHMEMTDALKAYIENGLKKIKAHFDRVIDVTVVLDVEKHRHIAEINLHANGVHIHSKEASSDMYASVDAVINKLEKQVRKYKERINRHQPRSGREELKYGHLVLAPVIPGNGDSGGEPDEGSGTHHVIKREQRPLRLLSVDEAVMHLELTDEPFFVFINVDTSQVNVIYALDDSSYGLIEPQL